MTTQWAQERVEFAHDPFRRVSSPTRAALAFGRTPVLRRAMPAPTRGAGALKAIDSTQRQQALKARLVSAAVALAALAHAHAPALAAASWRIDPARTHIAFAIDSIGYPRTHGEFRQFEGRISVDLEHPDRSRVSFHVQSNSVDVGSASFDDYLRSPTFLDAGRYPTIAFVSTSVAKVNDRTVKVNGELTLLGVTRPLSVEVEVQREGAGRRLAFLARTSIDRLEFGMNSGFPLVSRDVELVISSAAVGL